VSGAAPPARAVSPLQRLVQGAPLRQPLHVALVHFPIGLLTLGTLADVASRIADVPGIVRVAGWLLGFGLGAAGIAAVVGFVDWWDIRADHAAKRLGIYHLAANLSAVAAYAASALVRRPDLDAAATPGLALALSVAGFALLGAGGYLGGHLVYQEGIGVGRHRRATGTPADTLHGRERRAEGWADVAPREALGPGETLRVEVDGIVMAIADIDGRLYAFGEFCTHRFGPLSEGSFEGHEVTCPWHGSCFDVRTGEVVRGPAKAPVATYEVTARDGRILVRATGP